MKKVQVHGASLATLDQGSGPPILLVHAFPLDHSMWDAQIAALASRYRVIAPDLRGFGQSEVSEGTVTMEQFADDMAGLLDGLGVTAPVVYCGLSMGGYIGWQFYRKYPSRVRAMILCDTRAIADTPEIRTTRKETIDSVLREGPEPVAQSMIPKLLTPSTLVSHPELAAGVHRVIVANDPRGIAAAARGMCERPDCTDLLPVIRCPCLIVVGKFDAISTLEEMWSIAAKIPGAKLVTIAGAAHLTPVEQPAYTTAAIESFLASLESVTQSGKPSGS
jgi:pimeloyl-ACP methyl ester carboxylesterase